MGSKHEINPKLDNEYRYVLGNFYIIFNIENVNDKIIISDIEIKKISFNQGTYNLNDIWKDKYMIDIVKSKLGEDKKDTVIEISEYTSDKIKSYLNYFS